MKHITLVFKANRYLGTASRLALAGSFAALLTGQSARADLFDVNGTTTGFGVTNGSTYDWLGTSFWSNTTTVNDGTAGTHATWADGTRHALFVGAGTGTNYTVRLGSTGSTGVTLGNIALNVNAGQTGAMAGAAGDVTIGNSGDTGVLTLNANNSVGTYAGTLTINNPINLNAKTMNFRGGTVIINGVVSGTGVSKIAYGGTAFGFSTGPGTITLANTANTYAGRVNSDFINANFTLAVTKLANGGSNSSIGTSSANIGINGGTLKYIGSTGAQTTNLGLHIASGGATVDASGVTSADTISISGAPTFSAANQPGNITLTGTNLGNNTMAFVFGDNGTTATALTKNGAGTWLLNQASTYSGTTTLNAGTLKIGVDSIGSVGSITSSAIGKGAIDFKGGTISSDSTTARTILNAVTYSSASTFGDATNNGKLTFSAAVNLGTAQKGMTINSNVQFDGILSGVGGGITKAGAGLLTLTNTANTYTGLTSFSAGITNVGSLSDYGVNGSLGNRSAAAETATGDGIGLVFRGGTLQYTGSTPQSTNRQIRLLNVATNTIDASGTGSGTLSFTYNGTNTNLFDTAGTRTLVLTGSNTGANTFAIGLTDQNASTGKTSLTKSGAGTWVLTGANTFTGATTIDGGTLVSATVNALTTSSAVNISAATGAGTLRLATDTSVDAYVIGGSSTNQGTIISDRATAGAGITHVLGAAALGNNTYNIQAGSNVTSGTAGVSFASLNVAGGSAGTMVLNPTTATLTIVGAVNIGSSNVAKTLNLGGTSTGNAINGVISNGLNTLSLTKSNTSTWELSNANTLTGNTKVTGGTLKLTNNLALQNSAFDTSGAGTLDLTTINTPTFGGLTSGTSYVLPANVTSLTLNPGSGTQTYTGNLSGGTSAQLIKSGAGVQVLSGTNTYSGATTVNVGELRIGSAGALNGTSGISVTATGAAMSLDGGITVGSGKSITITGPGLSSFGALSNNSGTNEWAGNVTLGADGARIGTVAGALTVSGTISSGINNFGVLFRTTGAADSITLSGGSTYLGSTTFVGPGPIKLSGGANRLPTSTKLIFGASTVSGILDLNGQNQEVAGLSVGQASGTFTNEVKSSTAATLTVNTAASSPSTYSGLITGSINLVKSGSDVLTLSGQNTYTAGTRIDSGTLTLGHATNTLADSGVVNINGGTLALGANTDTVGVVTLTSGSITGTTGVLTSNSNFDVRSGSVSAILGGSLGLDKSTGGTITLSGVNTYTGATGITGGTVSLSGAGAINTSSGITINGSGAKLVQGSNVAVSPTVNLTQGTLTGSGTVNTVSVGAGTGGIISTNDGVGGTPLTIGSLTLTGGANINLFSNGTAADLIVTTLTNNSAANNVTITANSASGWINGSTYDLISYTTLNGTGANNFAHAVNNLSARQSAAWGDTGSAIQITVSGTNPYWVGDTDNKWNLSTADNWRLLSDNSHATFLATDDVLFDDNASGTGAVSVDIDLASVSPNTTIFNNDTRAYTLSSSDGYGISTGSLTKNNNGSVTISTINSYSGPTLINGGNLTISGSGTLGSGSTLTMGGGQLDLGGTSQTMGAVSVTAAAASGNTILNGTITGTSYAASNSTGNAIISANMLENGLIGFTKSGSGTVTLSGTNTWTGPTSINGGSVVLSGAGALANVSSLTVGGGSLDLGSNSRTVGDFFVTAAAGTGDTVSNGSITGTSYSVSNTSGNAIISANLLANGAIGFTKSGAGTVTLAGTNTYTGATAINAGTLAVGSSTAFTNLGALSISANSTLDLNGFNASFAGNVPTGAATSTITDSAAGTGTSTITFSQTTNTNVTTTAFIADGGSRKVGVAFSNGTSGQQFSNANNTFSGGLTLLHNTAGTRMQIASAPVFAGTPGALTSGTYGTGPITIGQAATDKAGIYISAANITLANAVVANTGLGNDRVGTFRIDSTGNTFSGLLTAGAADFTLSTNGTGAVNLTGKITGTNGLKLLSHSLGATTGAFTATLTNAAGTNDYAGNTTINENPQVGRAYTLVLGAADQIPNGTGKGNVVVNTNGTGIGKFDLAGFSETINGLSGNGNVTSATSVTLTVGDNDATGAANTFSGTLTGSLALTKTGNGALTLSGANTYTGTTTISGGTLQLGAGGTTGTLSTSSAIVNNGDFTISRSNAVLQGTDFSGAAITGSGSLTYTGGSTLTLNTANSYAGLTTFSPSSSASRLILTNASALGTTAAGTVINGASASSGSGVQLALSTAGMTVADETLTLSSDTGKRASLFTNTAGTQTWNGNIISSGAGLNAFWADAAGAVLVIGSDATDTITHNASNLSLRGSSGTGTVNSTISGTGALFKTDSGAWTISSTGNSYAGDTTINFGILSFSSIADSGANSSIGAGAVINLGQNQAGGNGTGTLQFTGSSGGSSNRAIAILNGATGGSGIIENTVAGQTLSLSGDLTTLTPASASALTLTGAGNGVLSGAITGAPNLAFTKSGAGSWIVSGANTYTGGTTLVGGILNLGIAQGGGGGPLGGDGGVNTSIGTIKFTGGTLQFSAANTTDYSSRFSASANSAYRLDTNGQTVIWNTGVAPTGTGTLTKLGAGTLSITTAANGWTGKTLIANGTLSVDNVATGAANQALGQNATLDIGVAATSSGTLTYTGGAATLDKNISIVGNGGDTIQNSGSGLLTLSGNLTKTGTTLTLKGGANGITISGVIQGTNTLFNSDLIVDGGTTTLTNANTYEGPTFIINGAALNANAANALPTANGRTVINLDQSGAGNSTLSLGANQSIASLTGASTSAVTLGSTTLTVGTSAGTTTYAGVISGTGGVTKDGASTQTLSGANTYTGTTTISNGTLTLSGDGRLADTGSVALTSSSSVFQIAGINVPSEKIAALAGVASATVKLGAKQLELGDGTGEFTGNIEDSGGTGGSVLKAGTGVQTLSGNNTYVGSTNISSGTLLLGSDTALPSTAKLNLSGGTLNTAGFSPSTGALSVNGAVALDLGAPGGTSVLSFNSVGTWTNMLSVWNYTGAPWTTGGDKLTFASTAGIDLSQVTFYSDNGVTQVGTGGGGLIAYGGSSFELVPVPEASTALGAALLLGVVGYRERRSAKRVAKGN